MLKTTTVLCVALLLLAASPHAQSPASQTSRAPAEPWYARSAKIQFQSARGPDAAFQIEWPRKDWMTLPGGGSLVLAFASKKGDAVVLVEQVPLRQALEADDITDLFGQLEADAIKERHPRAAEFQSKVIESGERRLVAVQFTRPGVLGNERVRQYSIPVGKQLYRLTCASAAAQFAAYDPLFAHMAATFSPG